MDIVRAFILGLVQAITEFLPISSSAHLILFRGWLQFESIDGLSFDIAVHMGTVATLLVYFRRDLGMLVRGFVASLRTRTRDWTIEHRLPWYIAAATVPAAVVGVLGADMIESTFRNPPVIAVTLVSGGLLFLWIERTSKSALSMQDMTLGRSLLIGGAQALALIPGVSRSGITITAGMWQQLTRAQAARFSFLLSVPIMLGAGVKEALDLETLALTRHDVAILLTGAFTSAAMGWVVVKFLLRFLRSHRLNGFAYYRFALAAVVVAWIAHN